MRATATCSSSSTGRSRSRAALPAGHRGIRRARARGGPTRLRRSKLGLLFLLVLAGCGGGGGDAAPPGPAIERATAERLASKSDAIADALDGGDVCGAAFADELNDQVIEAINAGGSRRCSRSTCRRARTSSSTRSTARPPPTRATTTKSKTRRTRRKGQAGRGGAPSPPSRCRSTDDQ